jgi:hypothetical protein
MNSSYFFLLYSRYFIYLLLLLLLQVAVYHFSIIKGILVFEGKFGIFFYSFFMGDRLHIDNVESLILSTVDILILKTEKTWTIIW